MISGKAGAGRENLAPVPARRGEGGSVRPDIMADRFALRELVENWALWRDAGDWDRFATVWHPTQGWMTATWFQGAARDFIAASREGFERGVNILHFLGGHTADVAGDRAVTQTKMTISQRGEIDGVTADVVCTGRFYDFCARHEGRWVIVRRQPIYEKDRLDVVDPAASLRLDPGLLARFPAGYRHLGYLQTQAGFTVKTGLPGLAGEATERLYAEGARWLAGSPAPGQPH
jgi:SnoaL-like domain